MSRSPTDPTDGTIESPRAGAWPRALHRLRQTVRGPRSQHVVYLQPSGVTAWCRDRPEPRVGSVAAFDTFASWASVHPGVDARLFLSGHLIHSLVIEPSLNLRGVAAVRGYAQQQFTHYHGPEATQWPLAVWSGPTGAGACAGHAIDLESLQAIARARDIRLQGVWPAWCAGLASLTATVPAFAGDGRHALLLAEGRLVTWLVAEAGAVVTLQQRYLDTPCKAAMDALRDDVLAQSAPLATSPLLVGWGLDDVATAPEQLESDTLPWLGRGAMTRWMSDRIGSRA